MRTAALTQLPFKDAAEEWLESRRGHLAPRTYLDYANYIRQLSGFFKEQRIPEIDGDLMRAYQQARSLEAGPGLINRELGIILQMRKRIGSPIADYQRLRQPKNWESPGRRLSRDEEGRLERVCREAAEVERWAAAAMVTLICLKAGTSPGEVRFLRLKDCSLDPPQIVIAPQGAKNSKRHRLVPLNDTAAWALEKLLDRAIERCGAKDPDHYLLPFRFRNRTFNQERPCSEDGWRTAQRQLFGIAEIKMRPNDCRHTAASNAMGNKRTTRQGIRDYFGWINDKMFQRYGHQELAELRTVAAAIERKPVESVCDPRVRPRQKPRQSRRLK